MVKFGSSDALAILRQFQIADDDNVPRHIQQLRQTQPREDNTLLSFLFNKKRYFVLIDMTAEDDESYITTQIRQTYPNANGELLTNPSSDIMTFGLPFKGKDVYLFVERSAKERLDSWLAKTSPDLSRSTWQKHIKAGAIVINGQPQLSPKYDVSPIDKIVVNLPDKTDHSSEQLPIIYQDEHVIVINKPVGVLSHSKGALNDEFTVADFFARFSTYHADTNRPGIIHRLDRDTSGVMIGALDDLAARMLQKQFSNRTVKKEYIAIVEGGLEPPIANIDVPIGRNPKAPSTFRADASGKPAQTRYEVLETRQTTSLVALRPSTGRTHQLRVHMKHIGHPIVGDKVYGKPADRMYLHARSLEITIPGGIRKVFEADVPSEFATPKGL